MRNPRRPSLPVGPAGAATAERAVFGTSDDGRVVEVITLRNAPRMSVIVSTRGGSIVELKAPDRWGRVNNILLGKPDFAAWEEGGNAITGGTPTASAAAGSRSTGHSKS